MIHTLLKQYRLPKWMGAYYVQINNAMFWGGLLNLLLGIFNAWYIKLGSWITPVLPWFNLPVFVVVVGLLYFLVVPLLHHKFITPTQTAYLNSQGYTHSNPIVQDIREILEILKGGKG